VNLDQELSSTRTSFSRIEVLMRLAFSILVLLALLSLGFAQATASTQNSSAPLTLTLQDALQRARQNTPEYRSALTDLGLAHEDRVQARAMLLPDVNYNTSYIYTQGTGALPASCQTSTAGCATSRFIANNGVHEYISQGNVHEALSLSKVADYRRSSAALALARAKAEIAARGLVVTVTGLLRPGGGAAQVRQ